MWQMLIKIRVALFIIITLSCSGIESIITIKEERTTNLSNSHYHAIYGAFQYCSSQCIGRQDLWPCEAAKQSYLFWDTLVSNVQSSFIITWMHILNTFVDLFQNEQGEMNVSNHMHRRFSILLPSVLADKICGLVKLPNGVVCFGTLLFQMFNPPFHCHLNAFLYYIVDRFQNERGSTLPSTKMYLEYFK
jgi:hypothetical protein